MTSARDEKEKPLWMPISPRAHAFALDENYDILIQIGISKDSKIAMEMIEGNVENPLHLGRIATTGVDSQKTPISKTVPAAGICPNFL